MFKNNVPDEHELISLLGESVYKNYNNLCEYIILFLAPDIEIWDYAGRRGKYFHGYRMSKRSILIDLYLFSTNGQGRLRCQLHFGKRCFNSILKQRMIFGKKMQEYIDSHASIRKQYNNISFSVLIEDEILHDVIKIIEIISGKCIR